MWYSHIIHICTQKHNDTVIKHKRTQFFRKIYLSLFWKGCVWEGVGDWTELQHIDLHSYGHNSISFPFSWDAQPGAWGPSLSGTWSSFQHLLSNSNCSIGGPEGPLCWVLVLSTASYIQLTWTSRAPSYIIVLRPLNSTCQQSRYIRPDAPVIYTGAFPILTARPGSICNGARIIGFIPFPKVLVLCKMRSVSSRF